MSACAVSPETFEAARLGDQTAIVRMLERAQPISPLRPRDLPDRLRRRRRDSGDALLLSRHVAAIRALAALSGWLFSVVRRECCGWPGGPA